VVNTLEPGLLRFQDFRSTHLNLQHRHKAHYRPPYCHPQELTRSLAFFNVSLTGLYRTYTLLIFNHDLLHIEVGGLGY